jgi:hypothetical protein
MILETLSSFLNYLLTLMSGSGSAVVAHDPLTRSCEYSIIHLLTSNIQHPTSSIQHPTSIQSPNIQLPPRRYQAELLGLGGATTMEQ